jgi:serine phosphatase RsbU (regulator of sigma subunit)
MQETSRKSKICIIDDDVSMRMILSTLLKKKFTVEIFGNAEEAIEKADIPTFDAFLADVRLPGMSGIDMIKEIRIIDESIPVILMTGMNDFETALLAIREGAFDFLVKPFLMEQVLVSVEKAVERRTLLFENRRLFKELTEKNRQLEELYQQIKIRNFQMERDLDIACDLQENLFPKTFPELERVSFSLAMMPLDKISGDFFDIFPLGGRKFMIILADVCGHGVPAALYSALIKPIVIVHNWAEISPAALVSRINEYLISSQKKMIYSYAAMFCAVFDPDSRSVTFCNAGVPAPILIRGSGEKVRLDSNGTIVGIFSETTYEEASVELNDGDRIILLTDGAFEGLPEPATKQGYEEMFQFVESVMNNPLQLIVDGLFNRLKNERGETVIRDDVTIIGIEFKK